MQTDNKPQSAAEFDRLVVQSPDSSMVWIAYMAYHLESAEIDKARGVAERALSTICFRYDGCMLNSLFDYFFFLKRRAREVECLESILEFRKFVWHLRATESSH